MEMAIKEFPPRKEPSATRSKNSRRKVHTFTNWFLASTNWNAWSSRGKALARSCTRTMMRNYIWRNTMSDNINGSPTTTNKSWKKKSTLTLEKSCAPMYTMTKMSLRRALTGIFIKTVLSLIVKKRPNFIEKKLNKTEISYDYNTSPLYLDHL